MRACVKKIAGWVLLMPMTHKTQSKQIKVLAIMNRESMIPKHQGVKPDTLDLSHTK